MLVLVGIGPVNVIHVHVPVLVAVAVLDLLPSLLQRSSLLNKYSLALLFSLSSVNLFVCFFAFAFLGLFTASNCGLRV